MATFCFNHLDKVRLPVNLVQFSSLPFFLYSPFLGTGPSILCEIFLSKRHRRNCSDKVNVRFFAQHIKIGRTWVWFVLTVTSRENSRHLMYLLYLLKPTGYVMHQPV